MEVNIFMPSCPAFRGTAQVNLSDHLNQVLHCATDSVDILLCRYCPIWYGFGGKLGLLQRIPSINAIIYPLTSIPLVIYSTIPAICLITGNSIILTCSQFMSLLFVGCSCTCIFNLCSTLLWLSYNCR